MPRPPASLPVDPIAERQVGQYYAFVEEILFHDGALDPSRWLADDFIEHGSAGERSRAEFLASLAARRARFPGAAWTIDLLAGAGDLVVCHTTMMSAERTGATARAQETAIVRFAGGKIVECWRTIDERP